MAQRINFNRNYKLYAACAKHDESIPRFDLEYVYFIDGYAYASDAHIAVRVPLEECTTFDEPELNLLNNTRIHSSLLRALYQFKEVEISEDVEDDDLQPKQFTVLSARQDDNEMRIILERRTKHPDFVRVFDIDDERQPIKALGIKPKLLATLTDAMGAVAIKLRFTQANGKVFVNDFSDGCRAMGIIMPLHIDTPLPGFEE